MVSFLHYWALENFIQLSVALGRTDDTEKYTQIADHVKEICNTVLWDGEWFLRGITADGRKIGTREDTEGRIHLESNAWAVLSGAADPDKAQRAMDSIDKYLYTEYGILLNTPSYTKPDDGIGFITRVYPGLKENGSIFSHPNPWAWAAECTLGRGDRAMKFYNALCPYYQNDKIEIREAEPYSYCQFIVGRDHPSFGKARHPFMTGSGGWAYFAATRYMLGIRPDFQELIVDPCVPADWKTFNVHRVFRGVMYEIEVDNQAGVMKHVKELYQNGKKTEHILIPEDKTKVQQIKVVMGK